MKKTLIIAGFPATGKSYIAMSELYKDKDIIDSDSSVFSKDTFPENYIAHIKENIGIRDVILVSTHKEVLEGLIKEGIEFCAVYPNRHIKSEYIERYINRGSSTEFIKLLNDKWDEFLDDLEGLGLDREHKVVLHSGQFISDIEWNILN